VLRLSCQKLLTTYHYTGHRGHLVKDERKLREQRGVQTLRTTYIYFIWKNERQEDKEDDSGPSFPSVEIGYSPPDT
jgi:hypothetical protein